MPPTNAELRAEVRRLRLLLAFTKRRWIAAEIPAFAFNQRRPACVSIARAEGHVEAQIAEFLESTKAKDCG
jgi:hypothetical protein